MRLILTITLMFGVYNLYTQEWQQVGNFNGSPRTLFTDTIDNILYIGGGFRFNGNDTLNGVCRLQGNVIQPMGTGFYDACGGIDCNPILSFIRYENEIYSGAYFNEIAGVPSSGIARWDGGNWYPITPFLYDENTETGYISGSCVSNNVLYVVGAFKFAGDELANSVASWDGVQWTTYGFPSTISGDVPLNFRVANYKDELYVGGNFYNKINGIENDDIARYDGNTWKQVGGGLFGGLSSVSDMVVYHDELYVAGPFSTSDGNAGNKIMRWDGTAWHDVGKGICGSGRINDMMVYNDKLYVAGIFNCISDGLPIQNVAVWDGQHWCSIGNSKFDNGATSIAVYNDEIYIGGGFTKIDDQPVKYFAKYIGDHSKDTCAALVAVKNSSTPSGQLSISPNPASGSIRLLVADETTAIQAIAFYDVAGRDCTGLTNLPASSAPTTASIDIHRLPAGLYHVRVQYAEKVFIGRFVKI
ncbi:MAG: T9SS type A sorting domain-containing protein [Saprospiraceae bacterium]|nr:T9SS type A sorting domain-containing protein [Saprospiraceae bacterium]